MAQGERAFFGPGRSGQPGSDDASASSRRLPERRTLPGTSIPASIKETPMTELLMVRRETHIAAPPATVFAFLTDPEKIISWMGTEAETEMHPGGLYLLKGVNGRVARGAFREVVPVHRLAYSFGWGGDEGGPPGRGPV